MTVDSQPAILTSGLARSYGKTPALLPTSLAVPQGSIFALLGHNGAGKTTLIKLLVNMLRPTSGEASVLGRPSVDVRGDDFLNEALLDAVSARPTTVFLSSHDLSEIESFATHVAFLNSGQLLFSEELPQLSARFREITVTLSGEEFSRIESPPSWLNLQHSGHTVRFVHSHANVEPVEDQVRQVFSSVSSIEMEPMNLRSIFLAVAREQQDEELSKGGL